MNRESIGTELKLKQKNCSNCGDDFGCGNTEGEGRCWCSNFPPLFMPDFEKDCLCPVCLKEATIRKINEYVESLRRGDALKNKAKDLPTTNQLIEDIDYYLNDGLFVFTKWYHLKRGYCCGNSCRHCPFK